jgi:hypothetical protein
MALKIQVFQGLPSPSFVADVAGVTKIDDEIRLDQD